jgi:hypothetical protein
MTQVQQMDLLLPAADCLIVQDGESRVHVGEDTDEFFESLALAGHSICQSDPFAEQTTLTSIAICGDAIKIVLMHGRGDLTASFVQGIDQILCHGTCWTEFLFKLLNSSLEFLIFMLIHDASHFSPFV